MQQQHRQPSTLNRYFRETIGELKKVSWPTREEAINLTKIVLIVIIAMALFLGVLDLLFGEFFALLLRI
ncbi:MAG: preprotein translocase subunit SecE [Chloroflexi bacterium]|nr:MAG: preprotein translocase subunit SecE [Chloroflexota bacterium]